MPSVVARRREKASKRNSGRRTLCESLLRRGPCEKNCGRKLAFRPSVLSGSRCPEPNQPIENNRPQVIRGSPSRSSHAGGPGFESLRAHHSNLSESVVCGFRSFPLLPSEPKNVSEPYQNAFDSEFPYQNPHLTISHWHCDPVWSGFPFHLSFICEYFLNTLASVCRSICVTHSSATPPALNRVA